MFRRDFKDVSRQKSENKNSNVATEEKLNRLKDSIKGTLTRLEAFTSEKTVSKETSVTEIEIKLKKIEQLQINLDKIAEDYCEIETFESLEIIQLDTEDINQRIETTESVDLENTSTRLVKILKKCTTVSAPFLATRTLKALADEEKAEFPDAADVIFNDSYMDDILSGESTLEGAKKLQTRLSQLLQRGGFELCLRKRNSAAWTAHAQ
ncbi:integrase catalytic domain-containing protein [Trichonephila clavipes]|nr:integrase catalytic domain-containing protein [Trichonephila clavipes]